MKRNARLRLAKLVESIRNSFWFVPSVMVLGAVGLSFGALQVDRAGYGKVLERIAWAYAGGPEGARLVLSSVASSMITVAGVAFSITIVALTLASSQFGPRLMRTFIADRGNQVVLGTFVATFLYCLLVLRTVRGEEDSTFVPQIAVTLALLLALVGIGVLIYFIHHIAVSLQAQNVIARVATELDHAIDRLFPEKLGRGAAAGEHDPSGRPLLPGNLEIDARPVLADSSGYLQMINESRLMELASEHDLVLHLDRRPGDFVVEGGSLLRVWPAERCEASLAGHLQGAFILGTDRTPTQDAEYSVRQLVEIAVRALSPGINDPFTAIGCIDWLGATTARLAGRVLPSPYRCDEAGRLRVVAPGTTFEGVADVAFHQIRQNGRSHAAVLIRLLEVLALVAPVLQRASDRDVLRRHAELVLQDGAEGLQNAADRQDLKDRHRLAFEALAHPPAADRPAPDEERPAQAP